MLGSASPLRAIDDLTFPCYAPPRIVEKSVLAGVLMPDRDVFAQHVERGWRASARRVFAAELTDRDIGLLVRQAAITLKQIGCLGLDRIAEVVRQASDGSEVRPLSEALARLDAISAESGSSTTRVACEAARLLLLRELTAPVAGLDPTHLPRTLAEEFVVKFIQSKVCGSCLTAELVEAGAMSFQFCDRRKRELDERLRRTPGVSNLARQILDDPSGKRVRGSYESAPKPALPDLMSMPLTVD